MRAEDVLFAVYDATLAFKATLPRLVPAGDIGDTDVYGAQQHARCSMSTFRSDSAAGRENPKGAGSEPPRKGTSDQKVTREIGRFSAWSAAAE